MFSVNVSCLLCFALFLNWDQLHMWLNSLHSTDLEEKNEDKDKRHKRHGGREGRGLAIGTM